MNKICTSLEQSMRLIELGIDVNTADMCWTNHLFSNLLSSWRIESTPPQEYKNLLDRFVVRGYLIEPAWSLTALLNIIKNRKDCNKVEFLSNYASKWVLTTTYYNSVWKEKEIIAEDSIDAVFQMVCWLKENRKL